MEPIDLHQDFVLAQEEEPTCRIPETTPTPEMPPAKRIRSEEAPPSEVIFESDAEELMAKQVHKARPVF